MGRPADRCPHSDAHREVPCAPGPGRRTRPPADAANLGAHPLCQKTPGWYPGWRTEYEYVRFGDELWEVHDVKTLFNRVYTRLWADHRDDVLAYTIAHDGPVFPTREWNGHALGPLDEVHYLFIGWFPHYMLSDLQRILDELGLADEVLIKYATNDE